MAPLTSADLLSLAPVIPVVVLHGPRRDAARAGAAGRRRPDHRGHAAHPRALDVIRITPTTFPMRLSERARSRLPASFVRRSRPAPFLVSPGTTDQAAGCHGRRRCPQPARSRQRVGGHAPARARPARNEILPRGGQRRTGVPERDGLTVSRPRFCPTGGITPATAPFTVSWITSDAWAVRGLRPGRDRHAGLAAHRKLAAETIQLLENAAAS